MMAGKSALVYLPEFDIIKLRVGMDVGVGNADELPPVGPFKLWRVQSFQHCNQSHIVLHRSISNSS